MNESKPESERRWIELLRWIGVVPAAMFAGWLFAGSAVFLISLVGIDLRGPGYPAFLVPLLQLLPSGVASTVVGALTAPRMRLPTASILAALAYSGGPFPLASNGLGDLFVFLFFGLVAVGGTYYVQALTRLRKHLEPSSCPITLPTSRP